MIGALRGVAQLVEPGLLLIFAGGVGYEVRVTNEDANSIESNVEILLYIAFILRQEKIELFGFIKRTDKELFSILINMNGVGGKIALMLISQKHVLARAIAHNEAILLTQIPGIGKKTAEKLLLELKDSKKLSLPVHNGDSKILLDAISALTNLGINRNIATKAAQDAIKNNPNISLEDLIRHTLATAK